jgi:hypothetical protein
VDHLDLLVRAELLCKRPQKETHKSATVRQFIAAPCARTFKSDVGGSGVTEMIVFRRNLRRRAG